MTLPHPQCWAKLLLKPCCSPRSDLTLSHHSHGNRRGSLTAVNAVERPLCANTEHGIEGTQRSKGQPGSRAGDRASSQGPCTGPSWPGWRTLLWWPPALPLWAPFLQPGLPEYSLVSPGPRALLAVHICHSRGHEDHPCQGYLQHQLRTSVIFISSGCAQPQVPLCKVWSPFLM